MKTFILGLMLLVTVVSGTVALSAAAEAGGRPPWVPMGRGK